MYLEVFHLEQSWDVPPVVIDREQILSFSRLYDPLPLHTDEEYAKTTRFGGLIAPGVLSFMAVWAKFLENSDPFGEELIAGTSAKIEWFKPVYADDVLTGRVVVTGVTRRIPYNGVVVTTIEARNQRGELVLTNVTESVVKARNS